ncbi:hydantoinase B/oxoprolinase family protein [Vreelandella titanicae]|uniref:hydantoinase B/oxoprolinase family protein n=1 Tax=Vreelandella titanicae TaxID=664683 RepID=UPI00315AE73F
MDTITYEIIRSSLFAIAREMKAATCRTAGSPIIHSGGDASAAIFDADMQLVAQGNDIPTMLGSAVISTKVSVEAIGRDKLRPGDVIISNDVYLGGGNHQSDIQFTRPVFVQGEIVAFTMTRGHWSDIGGQSPGSYATDTWDIFGEGVRIPPVRIYRDDNIVEDVQTLILQNTRDPETRLLDVQAQYAGCYVGEQRIQKLAEKYGAIGIAETMKRSLDHSEALMRDALGKIPDGVYVAEDEINVVFPEEEAPATVPLKVTITKRGDEIEFDYKGSGKQVRGGINCPFSVTCNSTWFTVKALTDVSIPINQGCYRPVTIKAEEGSVLNCTFPISVVSGNTETSPRVIDMLMTALTPAVPDRVIGQSNCGACAGVFGGEDPDEDRVRRTRRRISSFIDVHGGGMGARADKDGVSAVRVYVGNAGAQSVEGIEQTYPLRVLEWSLVQDSGGAGRQRGGLAARRVYEVLYDEATFTVAGERENQPPLGQSGGGAGAPFQCAIHHANGTVQQVRGRGGQLVVHRGDHVVIQPAGSGGFGVPAERDAAALEADILDGYVSQECAQQSYGRTFEDRETGRKS